MFGISKILINTAQYIKPKISIKKNKLDEKIKKSAPVNTNKQSDKNKENI